ncbi:MAG TPA: PAS domain-containing protein [Candidatus Sulfotelmatobacter sp.]|nr:PAS domain-containing protein [Candidatus Sulfotelmatobacter sp.]
MSDIAEILPAGADLPACDHRLVRLHRYWQSIRPAPEALPGRQHFDPAAVRDLLALIWLIDVHRAPLRFKYRLVGTVHVDAEGRNPTGLWLDEAHQRFAASSAYPQFVAAATEGRIAFYRGPPAYVIKKDYIAIERLILPLAADGREVDVLLGITVLNPQTLPP